MLKRKLQSRRKKTSQLHLNINFDQYSNPSQSYKKKSYYHRIFNKIESTKYLVYLKFNIENDS